ncbi:hypothetical protein BLOT_014587, partial [Blomia tropicalis]
IVKWVADSNSIKFNLSLVFCYEIFKLDSFDENLERQ